MPVSRPIAPLRPFVATAAKTLCVTFVLLLLSIYSIAQSTSGRVLGTVTDQTGAGVAGARIIITDIQRDISRNVVTDQSGAYVFPDLTPGSYKLRVEASGFKTEERPNIELEVAKDAVIDFPLQPGQAQETITVTEQVPPLDSTSSTLGGTLSNKEINDLPLNGRNYENLLQLRPGIVRYPGGGFSTTSRRIAGGRQRLPGGRFIQQRTFLWTKHY